jgi:hypothetical protein
MASAALMISAAAADPAQQRGSADPLVLIRGRGGFAGPTSTRLNTDAVAPGRSQLRRVGLGAGSAVEQLPRSTPGSRVVGQRALGAPGPETAPCPPLPRVVGRRVSGWDRYLRLQQEELASYGKPGVLGDGVTRAGSCALAVGRGAAVALATSTGRVAQYAPSLAGADLRACPVTIVDAGALPTEPSAADLRGFDDVVAEVVSALPPRSELLVSGIADTPAGQPGLQVAIDYPAPGTPAWLSSNSTRRTGIIQLTDLTATALTRVGVSYAGWTARRWRPPSRASSTPQPPCATGWSWRR